MAEGFFSISKVQGERKTGHLAHCGRCGLHKHCKSPKMPASGKGRKKILIVAEAPGKNEDQQNTQFIGKGGKLLRRFLKSLGVRLDVDCIKTYAIICRPRNEKPKGSMIEACRPNLIKTIRKYKPNVIFLLGGIACRSLLSELWKDDLGKMERWEGFCIPCRDPNAWIIPTFHLKYMLQMGDDKMVNRLFENHLRIGIEKADNPPWKEVPNYKKRIEIVTRPSQAAKILREMTKRGGASAFDFECNCLKPDGEGTEIVSCSVCWRGRRTISYPWQGEAIDATSELIESPMLKIASNLKMEDRWTRAKLGHGVKHWYWDTMLAAHVLDNRPGITSLKFQAFIRLGQENYNAHIKPFFKQKKGSKFNRIHELDFNDLLLYGGLDSYLEYWVAMQQILLMEERQ